MGAPQQIMVDVRALPATVRRAVSGEGATIISNPNDPPLPAGNVWVMAGGRVIVCWVLTPGELFQCIRDKRLFAEAAEMRRRNDWPHLIVVGQLQSDGYGKMINAEGKATGWSWSSIQGALLTVQELGVMVVTLGGPDELPGMLRLLGERERGPVRLTPAREAQEFNDAQKALLQFRGLGPETLAKLERELDGDYATILAALSDPEVGPGLVGQKLHAHIRQELCLDGPDGARVINVAIPSDDIQFIAVPKEQVAA